LTAATRGSSQSFPGTHTLRTLPSSRHRIAFVAGAGFVLAAILVATNQWSARTANADTASTSVARQSVPSPARSPFAGIPQRGAALGSPDAPVTLVEYADLQCPYCAYWARTTLPVLVDRYVRQGKLRIVFNGLAFIGSDSEKALRAAEAAGLRDRLWDVLDSLYRRQGVENDGWVTDELLRDVAAVVPGLGGRRLLDERWRHRVDLEIERSRSAAVAAGVNGTPSFQLGRTGDPLEPLTIGSLDPQGIVPAIEEMLAR
jgi:protein-disulfide isomerase